MKPGRKQLWFAARMVLYGAILLLAAAVAVPQFVQARWASCGVPVHLQVNVADAQSGKPVPGAKVLHWTTWDERQFIHGGSTGDQSATTDDKGVCEVRSHFPGSGSGKVGHLKPDWLLWVRAEGYEAWQAPLSALLGGSVRVTNAFQTISFPLTIRVTRF